MVGAMMMMVMVVVVVVVVVDEDEDERVVWRGWREREEESSRESSGEC